jgi:hypothetical protein
MASLCTNDSFVAAVFPCARRVSTSECGFMIARERRSNFAAPRGESWPRQIDTI